ncbi:MAG: hypothetical protein V8S34_04130 [Lawsonibacter sp.]
MEPAGAPRYARAGPPGQPVTLDTIADGTRTDHANPDNFQMIQARVDDLCTADDAHIRQAIRLLMDKAKLMVEPSAPCPWPPLWLDAARQAKGQGGLCPVRRQFRPRSGRPAAPGVTFSQMT